MFLAAGLTLGATSCSDDDENLDNVTPPEVVVVKGSVQGTVSSLSGAVAGATVKMGSQSATTDAKGAFAFADVAAGSYTLSVSMEGYETPADQNVTVADGKASVANFVMAKIASTTTKVETAEVKDEESGETVVVNTEEVKSAPIQTEVPAVAKEATVEIQAVVPPMALQAPEGKEVELVITTLSSEAAASRAAKDQMIGGCNVNTNAKFRKPISVDVTVSSADVAKEAKAKKYVDGKATDAKHTVNGTTITIEVDSNGSYTVVLPVSISKSSQSSSVSVLSFEKDNTYGNGDLTVSNPTYTYNVGGTVSVSGNPYLVAILAATAINTQQSVQGTYELGFTTVPVGTGITVSGKQSKTESKTTATLGSLSATVTATTWGAVSFSASSYNRQHTGGGSK